MTAPSGGSGRQRGQPVGRAAAAAPSHIERHQTSLLRLRSARVPRTAPRRGPFGCMPERRQNRFRQRRNHRGKRAGVCLPGAHCQPLWPRARRCMGGSRFGKRPTTAAGRLPGQAFLRKGFEAKRRVLVDADAVSEAAPAARDAHRLQRRLLESANRRQGPCAKSAAISSGVRPRARGCHRDPEAILGALRLGL